MHNYEDYSLDNLITTFALHGKMAKKEREEFKVKYPDVSHQAKDDFYISLALHSICKEIKTLKDRGNDAQID